MTRKLLWLALELRRTHTAQANWRRAQSVVAEIVAAAGELSAAHVKELDETFAPAEAKEKPHA